MFKICKHREYIAFGKCKYYHRKCDGICSYNRDKQKKKREKLSKGVDVTKGER